MTSKKTQRIELDENSTRNLRQRKSIPAPAYNSGVDGIDRRNIDNLTLDRDMAEMVKEVWE